MNKEIVLSVFRSILTAVGAYLVGNNFLGNPLDEVLWQGIVGAALTLTGTIWGIVTKEIGIEQLQSGLRSVITFAGALLVGTGLLKEEVVASILAIVATIVPIIYSQVSKLKSKEIAKGEVAIGSLIGVDETKPSEITPVKVELNNK